MIFKILVFIILFFIVGAFVKIFIDVIRGKSKQKLFKKRDISGSDIDILSVELSRIKGYHKILKTDDYLIYINEYHVDIVLFCDYCGMLSGEEYAETWEFNSDLEKKKVYNPLIVLENLRQELIKKTGINEIRAYILLGSNTRLNLHISKTNVIRRNNAYYTLARRKEKKKYNINDIDLIYEKIMM